MQLQMQRVRPHRLRARVERLEPRILLIHALERELQAESRGQRAGERGLPGAHHAGDAEQHQPIVSWSVAGSYDVASF